MFNLFLTKKSKHFSTHSRWCWVLQSLGAQGHRLCSSHSLVNGDNYVLLYTFKYMTMRMEFETPYSRFVVKGTTPHSKLPSTREWGSPSWHFLGQERGICLFYEYFILLCTQSLHILRIWGPPTYSRYLVKGTTSHSTLLSTRERVSLVPRTGVFHTFLFIATALLRIWEHQLYSINH